MRKIYNFSAGPGMLPEEVLLQAQEEMLDWQGTGMSIMELGHRGPEFKRVADLAETDLRELVGIPNHYHVLFLVGGATAQFAMVPLNLMGEKKQADYVNTGIWSAKAIQEAQRYGQVNIAANLSTKNQLAHIPPQETWQLSKNACYLHYTPNETISGIEFNGVPHNNTVPLIADMSSMFLSRPIDVTQYGIIYSGAQKNIGQAGITVVIIRDDLIREPLPLTPTLYQYKIHAEHHSFYNTPPTYSWYITGLVLAWAKRQGGIPKLYAANQRKAHKLYEFIDQHADFYINKVHHECRSIMNVVFTLSNEELIKRFIEESTEAGLTNLKGHRTVGGLRASLYNAMPEKGVDTLIDFMRTFEKTAG